MLKILVKKQLAEIFRSYTYDAKKNKARSKGATIGFIVFFVVLMVGVLGGMFTFLSLATVRAYGGGGHGLALLHPHGPAGRRFWASSAACSTPIPACIWPRTTTCCCPCPFPCAPLWPPACVSVYLMGLMYSGIVLLPAIIVYWITVGLSVQVVLGCVVQLLLMSVFVLTLSCALGWLVAKISRKLKNKSFITVLISLVFIGAYYFFYAKAQSLLTELVANAVYYGDTIRLFGLSPLPHGSRGRGRAAWPWPLWRRRCWPFSL